MSLTININRIRRLFQPIFNPKDFYCPVCDTYTDYFLPLNPYLVNLFHKNGRNEKDFDLLETFNYRQFECPNCRAKDKYRLYALYLRKYFKNNSSFENRNFLDFAPEFPFTKFIKNTYKNINYRTADLMMDGVDDKVDICDMKIYKDNSMDFFVCSHVLEHVVDDHKAMGELFRVLKPGGKGIAMVPIQTNLKENLEDPNITSEVDRWKYYGQDDHLRMYSKNGFIKHLTGAGFKVETLGINEFGAAIFKKTEITPQSILYVVSK
jgi:SAM-dependent methyltransferase